MVGTGAIVGITVGSVIAALVIVAFLTNFLKMWLRGPTCGSDCRKRLDGKVVAITGANTGIGKETALDLAKRGARLILLCRNLDKAQRAAEEIKKIHIKAQITIHQLDLASLKSVRACAQTLIDTEDKIDILVNNAGIMMYPEIGEHTSELQSHHDLVCRLLLEKKKKNEKKKNRHKKQKKKKTYHMAIMIKD